MNAVPVALELPQLAALAAALGWASGMRLYAVVFITGAAGHLGWLPLPPGLQVLQHPLVLGLSFVLFVVEFVADKIPAVDTLWDAVHTFIRIPAGAALAAGALGADHATWAVLAALAGGSLAATAHAAKATTRAAANTSPEPFSNVLLSLAGDAAVPLMLWLAVQHPAVFWPVLALAMLLALVLIAVLFRFLRALLRRFMPRPPRAA
ncbi:MAG: DUF4126 domain-containing protein [Betaproteobacteria bacterium]|jgi:hypothetical protein|nr:DUF4126 domain-containing protein [Rubrivivax sp.]MCZ8175744.1 DUF4126 domain-containing protein [Burkholderiaceae bacterium]